jgi:hypothetical protein
MIILAALRCPIVLETNLPMKLLYSDEMGWVVA